MVPGKVFNILPDHFAIRQFYRDYLSAEGEVGATHVEIWPEDEIADVRENGNGGHPMGLFFFGGDGAGDWFGCPFTGVPEEYFRMDATGNASTDLIRLGGWEDFVAALKAG